MARIEKVKYLVIGNSAGGIGATEAIREVDRQGSLVIISDEPYPAYSRPLISGHLAEGYPVERMLYRSADFYEKNNIRTFLGRKVERLQLDEHTVGLGGRERIGWERLLLATGGVPIIPQVEGIGMRGVFTFTTLEDAKAIDLFLKESVRVREARAVVIGGGLIGVSVAEALAKREVGVTIVEMKERILNTILDEEASAIAEKAISQSGIKVLIGHSVAEVNDNSTRMGITDSVTLDDGSRIPCELVIVAIGVLPRIELVADDGMMMNRGIVVDRHMATSSPNVYACGDVAEAYDFVYGGNRLTPIWPNAYIGGRVAGFNMAGVPTEYQGGTAMNSLKYFGLDIVSAGMVSPPDDSYEVLSSEDDITYRRVILKDGLVVGMVFVGNIEKSGIVFGLMKNRVNVDGFKQTLVASNFGLASLPEEIWRSQLEMPLSASVPVVTPAGQSDEETTMGE